MLSALVLALSASPTATVALTPTASVQDDDRKAEYDKRREAAEGDADALWDLYAWCDDNDMSREGRSVLRAIIKIDDSKKAHELLGEILYDGRWFANEKKVEEYKKRQLKEEAKKTGKVIYEGELVDPEDIPFLERGLVRGENGEWISAEEHQRIQDGWVRQDLEWVSPDEVANLDKGLYKCGDEWLSLEDANAYHSELGQWWRIPSDHFLLYSTCDRRTADASLLEAERIYAELVRVFGRGPSGPVMMVVLRSLEQYNLFATGSETMPPVELRGFSSLHGVFLAEVWPEPYAAGLTAAGVAYWDAETPAGQAFGRTYVRHAAGQSFAEALDPSPEATAELLEGEIEVEEFWPEKKLPQWFRYGAAAYVERYFIDSANPEGPLAWRNWSISNIASQGGLDPLERVFEFSLSLDDQNASAKLINESGLLMAFILDGECPPVVAKHLALKDAFKKGKDLEKAAEALEKELVKNESDLRTFAGL